jgi:hypothetical protein
VDFPHLSGVTTRSRPIHTATWSMGRRKTRNYGWYGRVDSSENEPNISQLRSSEQKKGEWSANGSAFLCILCVFRSLSLTVSGLVWQIPYIPWHIFLSLKGALPAPIKWTRFGCLTVTLSQIILETQCCLWLPMQPWLSVMCLFLLLSNSGFMALKYPVKNGLFAVGYPSYSGKRWIQWYRTH